jgi:hypothetical protein
MKMDTLTRKEELQGMIDSRTNQIAEGVSLATQGVIESEINAFKAEIAAIEEAEQNEAAQKVVIQEATQKADYFLDNLVVEGLTMSQLSASDEAYQLLRMAVQSKIVELEGQAVNDLKLLELSHKEELRAAEDRELQLQRQNDELQKEINDGIKTTLELVGKLKKEQENGTEQALLRKDAESKRDAAMAKVDGLELLVSEKQAQIDILRTENAVGASKAPYVIDMEVQRAQMKELADQIKASRIHVYDVKPDNDINPKNYTAKRADNDQEVSYNWTQRNKYIELKDEEEVNRFRQQHAEQSAVSNPTLDPAYQIQPIAEVTAPESFPTEREVQTVPAPVASGVSSEDGKDGETVSRKEFEDLKATVNDLCRVCDIAEVA